MAKPKDMQGRELEPGWYWVLHNNSDELELARLVCFGKEDWGWLRATVHGTFNTKCIHVHSGPIRHPYEGRWSACAHYPEFRRGARCVYCGTLNLPTEA